MAYTRTYRTVVPVPVDASDSDVEVVRWLARESFERTTSGDGLRITDYSESVVPAQDMPPKAAKALGRPLTDFVFYAFIAQATNA